MAGRRQIGGHGPSHIAEPDESDVRHVGISLSRWLEAVAPSPAAYHVMSPLGGTSK